MSAHKIFICYSSQDEARARVLLEFMEGHALKCWISSRDVRPGENYQESIVTAIQDAGAVIFLFSDFSNKTGEVRKELSLASSFDVPVIPVRLSSTALNSALRYELATRQWIDAFPHMEDALPRVAVAVSETLRARFDTPQPQEAAENAAWETAPAAPRATQTQRSRAPVVASGSAEFEALRALLAQHVGPIAKILIQKAAMNAETIDQLCEQIATHVQPPAEQTKFLRAARQRLAALS